MRRTLTLLAAGALILAAAALDLAAPEVTGGLLRDIVGAILTETATE